MQKLSKLIFSIFFFILLCFLSLSSIKAVDAIPELLLSCTKTKPNEFHSVRPYQAAPCGEAPTARFCSNRLIIFEEFNMAGEGNCHESGCENCEFTCEPDFKVEPHNLNITLDESEFPIMGNTEDEFDDATKVNEYASWYLNGIIDKKESKDATDEQIVNYSGPLRKLLPSMIQDAQRIKTISSIDITKSFKDSDTGETITDADNHDQLVIDNERLSAWKGDLSFFRLDIFAWDKRTPPLPWDDGTVTDPNAPKIPFKSEILYQKAYKEWRGKSCVILPILGLLCVDIKIPTPLGTFDIISNKYSDLWHYVPLSNNTDKKGKNVLLTADGPNYVAYSGTVITDAQHESYLNAPLYFAHTQEVKELSSLLNQTYLPDNFKESSQDVMDDVEKLKKGLGPTTYVYDPANPSTDPYDYLDCTAVNVRTNEGDNLFPGDRPGKPNDKELFVKGAQYLITQATCHEKHTRVWTENGCKRTLPNGTKIEFDCWVEKNEFRCPAGVGIEFKLGTETPWANEIFKNTVAGTGSTFRKIFPKVSDGAPVNCIADIPTTTGVEYSIENDLNEKPNGGSQRLGKESIPADGASGMELTFSHVGSVYEYFLHGIQTALRPKGYGYPIANGNCTPSTPITCGDWETKLGDSGGACGICNAPIGELAKKILTAAGTAFNVPASSVWAAMKHEGADWPEFQGQFTDENVRKWSTPVECGGEPMPGCDPNDKSSSKSFAPFGFLPYWFYKGNLDVGLWAAVQKFDPTRNSIDTVSHCNFLDAAFAASKNLQLFSGFSRTPSSCYGYNMASGVRPGSCSTDSKNWSDDKIVQSHVGYWIGITPWCPDGTGGPTPPDLGNNVPLPNYARDVLSNFKSAKCN